MESAINHEAVATHRVGWATVTNQQKYHHYDAKGLTRCGYRRKKGELSFANRPADLSAWECCSTCDSVILRTNEPAAATATFNYATEGQHLADVRAEQDWQKTQEKWQLVTPEQWLVLRSLSEQPRPYEIYGPDAQQLRVLAGYELAALLDDTKTKKSTWHPTAAAYGVLTLELPQRLRRAQATYEQAFKWALAHPALTTSPATPAAAPAAALLGMSKFIVSSSALLKTLTPLAAVVPNNPVVPALGNFLFEVAKGKLQVTASDLETSITTSLPVESGKDELRLCVPSRLLLNLLKQLPDQPITCDVNEEEHHMQVKSANGRYKIVGESAADYPKVPVPGPFSPMEIPSTSLARAISKTNFAISTDELRPAMTGVLVELEPGSVTFVATDGHRLLRYRRLDVGCPGAIKRAIVPRNAWKLLKSLLPADAAPVQVKWSTNNAFFEVGPLRLVCRLIDERYPDYENVIPISNPNKLLITRPELLRASQRCALMSNKTTHQIRLSLAAAELTLAADDLDFGSEARETLTCQYDGEPMEIGFNADFLHQMLGALDDEEVTLSMSTPNRAGLLEPAQPSEGENILMLVMPVMLNNYV